MVNRLQQFAIFRRPYLRQAVLRPRQDLGFRRIPGRRHHAAAVLQDQGGLLRLRRNGQGDEA